MYRLPQVFPLAATLEIHSYQVNIVFVTNYSHVFLSNILHILPIAASVPKHYENLSIT